MTVSQLRILLEQNQDICTENSVPRLHKWQQLIAKKKWRKIMQDNKLQPRIYRKTRRLVQFKPEFYLKENPRTLA